MTQVCLNRFECINRMLPARLEQLVEIGYDHGQNLLRAAAKLPGARILGIEKQAGARDRFLARHGHKAAAQRIELRHGLGLSVLRDAELDTLLFAGLGERNICAILAADPRRLGLVRQLFCMPLQRCDRLAPFLQQQGFVTHAEDTAIERNRYYPLTQFVRSVPGPKRPPPPGRSFWPRHTLQ